jgi:hypothetical protein
MGWIIIRVIAEDRAAGIVLRVTQALQVREHPAALGERLGR